MFKNNPELEWIDSKEIMKKYPAFENLPDSYIGNIAFDAGNIKIKNAINGFRILSELNSADLRYNSGIFIS